MLDVYREHGGTPPALSIGGARRIPREHSDASGLVGSDGEHLKLHGARRGLGNELYTHDTEAAQEALRHQSIETTHKSYRDRDGERAQKITRWRVTSTSPQKHAPLTPIWLDTPPLR